MDTSKYMIILNGEIKTQSVRSCEINENGQKYNITFMKNTKIYSYGIRNVIFMSTPKIIENPPYMVETPDGKWISDIIRINEFDNDGDKYWHITSKVGYEYSYKKSDLQIIENCLSDTKSAKTFDYLKDISQLSKITNDSGEKILKKYYEEITFISANTALSLYLDNKRKPEQYNIDNIIFPFGCNQSQYKAVKNAINNQISVIQGPPGTGKTQTILNIIANLIINGKTVLVVSNNNAATGNVLEKLAKEKYGMDFMVAPLGSVANKETFLKDQKAYYPDLFSWEAEKNIDILLTEINEIARKLQFIYQLQEEIAKLKERYYEIDLEYRHFKEYANDIIVEEMATKFRRQLSLDRVLSLWQELQSMADDDKGISLWFKLKCVWLYGIGNWNFYKQDLTKIITVFQGWYYERSLEEITIQLDKAKKILAVNKDDYDKQLERKSLMYLKATIAKRYAWRDARQEFSDIKDIYYRSKDVLKEYPIVLSTTFSSRTSLDINKVQYDYVIMDEASQVDVATGALALSCAKNAVIVGDLKQLPNVVTLDVHQKAAIIRDKYNICDVYDFASNSFLKSITELMPNVPSILLKEHYRCHPRIISFCNRKFYNNELVIMTEDDKLGKALKVVKTVEGNHAREHYNQREIDVIKTEIIPKLEVSYDEIGIITPYNEQASAIKKQIPEIYTATVHKFQGREKEVIVLSTVDNQIRDFTDDPYLLNVAVSRAKKRLIVVTSGNKQMKNGNITDLISYIQYNGMEIVNSRVYSIFDYLYSQYRERRWKLLKDQNKQSAYESENIAYMFLKNILKDYPEYDVQCFQPLSMLIRDLSRLSDDEVRYASHPSTHVDFMIYNKLSKEPRLVIEVDGYQYHAYGTTQYERDLMKNKILSTVGINIIRLKTNESGEKERVLKALGCK